MNELRPIEQVKEIPSEFTTRIYTPEEKKEWRFRRIAASFKVSYDDVLQWELDDRLPKSFTCNKCTWSEWEDKEVCKRCKDCSRQRSGYRRAKKWKKLILQEWLKRKELQKKKFKTLKFMTLTVENFIGQNLTDQEVKAIFMKPFRKYLKECNNRGWIIGGLYAYECTYKQTKQEQWFSGRSFTKPGQRTKASEDDRDVVVTEYHPHVHIISIGPRVDQQEHRSLWNECLNASSRGRTSGQSKGVVNTEVARQLTQRVGGVHIKAIDSVRKSLWYVVEYIKKSSLQGRNREAFGCMRGCELDDNPVLNLQ
jgi:hypothetical protein